MGQHQPDEQPYSERPVIESTGTSTIVRHYADYVRTGSELAGELINDRLDELLYLIDERLSEKACEPFRLESGEAQFVNNWTVAHARAKFSDKPSESSAPSGRHLVRLWNYPLLGSAN